MALDTSHIEQLREFFTSLRTLLHPELNYQLSIIDTMSKRSVKCIVTRQHEEGLYPSNIAELDMHEVDGSDVFRWTTDYVFDHYDRRLQIGLLIPESESDYIRKTYGTGGEGGKEPR